MFAFRPRTPRRPAWQTWPMTGSSRFPAPRESWGDNRVGKLTIVETRLHYRLPVVADESWILVVNIHAR
jgi:hypothetical protein